MSPTGLARGHDVPIQARGPSDAATFHGPWCTGRVSTTTRALTALVLAATLALGGCGGTSEESGDAAGADFPDVTAVEISEDGATFTLDVTMSSPYDSPKRYADGWRVLDEGGDVLGEMELGHDHADEQPFTRSQTGVEIPQDVTTVTVEGHDSENGYGGATVEATVPGR